MMRRQPSRGVIVAIVATLLLIVPQFAREASAQGAMATGEIQGIVQDPDGVGLPGATVTIRGDTLIQESLTKVAGANGDYLFRALRPGTYTVTIEMPGFTSQEILATPTRRSAPRKRCTSEPTTTPYKNSR